jgi:hypothetical protein
MKSNPLVLPILTIILLGGIGLLADESKPAGQVPAPFDMKKAEAEISAHYAKAHPEVQEYVRWTARQFGPGGLWLNEDAFAGLPAATKEEKIRYLAALLEEGEYGRHLCTALAEAGALTDKRLLPGLKKVAGYHVADRDYDCRAKWIAVAGLARQDSDDAVPLLVSLVDHGNQNTRQWARAALSRKTGQDFKQDKQAWANWWQAQGHAPIPAELLKPWQAPAGASK